MSEPAAPSPWGPTSVPLHSSLRWQLGPLFLVVSRRPWEWAVSWWWDGPPVSEVCRVAEPIPDDLELPADAVTQRFAFGETVDPLTLTAALGDRIFVAMPSQPFFVLPADSVRTHMTVPLWVQVRVGQDARLAVEIPVHRPQDTWFGGPTAGTLGYASRTAMQLQGFPAQESTLRAHLTVDIVNRADTPLQVSRLRLPVPQLALLRSAEGRFVTPPIRYTRQRDDLALIDVGAHDPAWTPVAAPRQPSSAVGDLTRAFNAFFGRIT